MEEWEEWAIISGIVALACFVCVNIVNYGLIIFGGPNLGLLLPIKTLIVMGIIWSLVIIIANIIFNEKKGLIGYVISIFTFLFACATTYWAFFVEKFYKLNDINDFKSIGMKYLFVYGSVAVIIGMASLFYFTFSEE